jgi:FlaA1/EpsC-like NDP-sugar epimerase
MNETSSSNPWQGKRVLITGVCGTVGRELLRQVCQQSPAQVIGLDNNESELFFVREEMRSQPEVQLYLGDMRDRDRLIAAMDGIDVVLHSAALKHVILCEQSPRDAIQSNILGVQNIIDAARAQRVERVLFTSSDKAVNPTNVMGTSKLMGERLMTAANAMRRGAGPIFASTRFGNVLGSRGSVIPLFRRQIAQGGPVTLTDARMTRFIMTLEAAVRLVMDSTFLAHGGEVFVTKMPVARIEDLAAVMIEELAPLHGYDPAQIAIETIGSKPGEKLYEELMNDEETRRTVELPNYFVVLPAFKSVYEDIDYCYPRMGELGIDRPYNSSVEPALGREALRQYLKEYGLLHEAPTNAIKTDAI